MRAGAAPAVTAVLLLSEPRRAVAACASAAGQKSGLSPHSACTHALLSVYPGAAVKAPTTRPASHVTATLPASGGLGAIDECGGRTRSAANGKHGAAFSWKQVSTVQLPTPSCSGSNLAPQALRLPEPTRASARPSSHVGGGSGGGGGAHFFGWHRGGTPDLPVVLVMLLPQAPPAVMLAVFRTLHERGICLQSVAGEACAVILFVNTGSARAACRSVMLRSSATPSSRSVLTCSTGSNGSMGVVLGEKGTVLDVCSSAHAVAFAGLVFVGV
jgi:hypothetical protein